MASLPDEIASCDARKSPENVNIAGFITSVNTGVSRFGKPYLRAVIEDFDGSYELAVNGKDIEDIKARLQENTPVYIEGRIEEKYFRKPEDRKEKGDPPYDFKIRKIIHLGNVVETHVKGLMIHISTTMLNSSFRERLVGLIKENKGSVPLTMKLTDPQTRFTIEFLSRKFQISLNLNFIDQLNEMQIGYKVIRK